MRNVTMNIIRWFKTSTFGQISAMTWTKLERASIWYYTEAFAVSLSQKIMHVELLSHICFYKKVVRYVFQADES